MHSYTAYGLSIRSTLRLPELTPAPAAADAVIVDTGDVKYAPGPIDDEGRFAWAGDGEGYLYWDTVGGFQVEAGRKITINLLPDADEELIRVLLLGPVFALLLRQRGFLVLHASAVAINGRAVAFIGRKGWGKSTTAAALHARGHALVTDDILPIDLSTEENPQVAPGFPQLKLWPQAAEASLGDDPETLPALYRGVAKRARRTNGNFSVTALPLQSIYVLDRGPSLSVESISPQDAFLELTRHTFNQGLLKFKRFAPSHLRRSTQLARSIPLRRLKRPAALNALSALARRIESDVMELRGTAPATEVERATA